MTPPDPDGAPLRRQEVQALAEVYHSAGRARRMLRSAGFPAWAIPAGADTMGDFWGQVSSELEGGVMAAGRTRILAKAHDEHPFHPVFAAASRARPERAAAAPAAPVGATSAVPAGATSAAPGRATDERLRVMLLGAEPARYGATRASAELRAAVREGGRLDMRPFPAAGGADLGEIRSILPHVLHLACHGTRDELILEDAGGEAHHLAADDLRNTLRLVAEHRGHRLRALVLRSCEGQEVAELFTPYADVVIAHRGRLDAECSVLFAAAFYRELAASAHPADARAIGAAARFAAQDTVNQAAPCRSVQTQLIVLPGTA
ncbi:MULTISPECIES: effector-associated domain EAD1-containing protein [unclassified Streptomyces]|uniref:effector-associated domain EAD1-containing protein n=1 Tax=unclassified Streptomyces TaxID=2593676 RepID=UPI003D75E9B2